jgi:hypothetical protein
MDEAGSWDNLHERFEVKRINLQEAYSKDNACINWAEGVFLAYVPRGDCPITTLPVRPFCGMLRKALGERTTAVCRTVSKSAASRLCL